MISKQAVYDSYYKKGVQQALNQIKLAKIKAKHKDNLLFLTKVLEREALGSTLRSNTLKDVLQSIDTKDIKKFPFIRSSLLLGDLLK